MKTCSVPGCVPKEGTYNQQHGFPKRFNRPRWLKFCGLMQDDETPKYICYQHFPDDAYLDYQRVLNRPRNKWRLQRYAVPSLNPPPGYVPDEEGPLKEPSQKPFKCKKCPRTFVGPGTLKGHVKRVHEIVERVICEYCGLEFGQQQHLEIHLKQVHNTENKKKAPLGNLMNENDAFEKGLRIKCEKCGICVVDIESHTKQMHFMEYIPSAFHKQKIQCEQCAKKYPRHKMHSHVITLHKKLKCPYCPEEFSNYEMFKRHKHKHLGTKFPCPHCPKVSDTAQSRRKHIMDHHPSEYTPRSGGNSKKI